MAMEQPLNLQRVWWFSVMNLSEGVFVRTKSTADAVAVGVASLSKFATEGCTTLLGLGGS
jgi:hypothetical protein